jgi:hypothetical protein
LSGDLSSAQYRDPVDISDSTDRSETVNGHVAERGWVGEDGAQVPPDPVAKLLDVDTVVRHANLEPGHNVGVGRAGLGHSRIFSEKQGSRRSAQDGGEALELPDRDVGKNSSS